MRALGFTVLLASCLWTAGCASAPQELRVDQRGELVARLNLPKVLADGRLVGSVSAGRSLDDLQAMQREAGETPFSDFDLHLVEWEHGYTLVVDSSAELGELSARLVTAEGAELEPLPFAEAPNPINYGTSANGGDLSHLHVYSRQAEFERVPGRVVERVLVEFRGQTHSLPAR